MIASVARAIIDGMTARSSERPHRTVALAVAALLAGALASLPREASAQRCTQMRAQAIAADGAAGPPLIDVHCESPAPWRMPLAAAATAVSAVSIVGAVVFTVLEVNSAMRLDGLATMRDPTTNLPLVSWSEIAAEDNARRAYLGAAIGLYAGGAALGVAAAVLFALPSQSTRAASGALRRPPRVGLAPGVGSLTLRF